MCEKIDIEIDDLDEFKREIEKKFHKNIINLNIKYLDPNSTKLNLDEDDKNSDDFIISLIIFNSFLEIYPPIDINKECREYNNHIMFLFNAEYDIKQFDTDKHLSTNLLKFLRDETKIIVEYNKYLAYKSMEFYYHIDFKKLYDESLNNEYKLYKYNLSI